MVVAEKKARARNEAAQRTMPRMAGAWTVVRCRGCGRVCGMPAGIGICLRCQANATRRGAKEA